jgi:hypothetical protein
LERMLPCEFSVEAPEPVARLCLGLAIERVLEVLELLWGCYLLRAISLLPRSASTRANKQRPL